MLMERPEDGKRLGQVAVEMKSLGGVVESLRENIVHLAGLLSPVLSAETVCCKAPSPDQPEPKFCSLANAVRQITEALNQCRREIENLYGRLEL